MSEKYEKKQAFEFCEIRNIMVRLNVIQSTILMPDLVNAEIKLVPIECNREDDCKSKRIRCIVFDRDGLDPCPEAWRDRT